MLKNFHLKTKMIKKNEKKNLEIRNHTLRKVCKKTFSFNKLCADENLTRKTTGNRIQTVSMNSHTRCRYISR